ncbi:hypothetical protein B9Q01_04055 [Candidatus Marsarchaeota G1 archaeon OSP_D]|uniref:BFN domain-containing protein n=1 Tax=Candidatus Marsarchaeota G1 archaeon OSP_D TaxID=1978155 RepID=A0A2R6AB31_9ARCH|nr:MAG: hypothetical protein B9Q01_04055 [Candidatus Marsarchaeota G1 archaeon OSP_D]
MGVLGVYKVNSGNSSDDVVFLVDESNQFVLHIFIGPNEAMSIQLALEGIKTERPITHDLIVNLLDELHVELEKVTIDGIIKNTYIATLYLRDLKADRLIKVDARPSDSIAIALRTGTQIYANSSLKEQMIPKSSLKLPEKDQGEKDDDDIINSPYGV